MTNQCFFLIKGFAQFESAKKYMITNVLELACPNVIDYYKTKFKQNYIMLHLLICNMNVKRLQNRSVDDINIQGFLHLQCINFG